MNTNKLLYILIGGIAILVFITIIFILRNVGGGGQIQQTTLQFWGVFDDHTAFDKVIADFEKQNPGIKIVYREFTFADYENGVVNALASGAGPDIWMIQNNWLPKHIDKLTPMPATVPGQSAPLMTVRDFQNQFVDVAANDLISNNQIYALPLYVDTLALYYNKDLFNNAGITRPPTTWNEFNSDVALLTKLDRAGNITQAGAAIGTARNINRSTDILGDLMIQSGVQMTDATNSTATFSQSVNNIPVGEVSLKYYTDFANPRVTTYTWNDSQHYSIDAFTEGTVAMMFNYSHQAATLQSKATRLNYGIAPMPQINISDIKNYANYWAAAVSKKSAYPNEAWKFITYLTSSVGATSYINATSRPSARRDIIDLQKSDPDVGIFAVQALTARSWYEIDDTAIEGIFADMIDAVNSGASSVRDALQNAESSVNVLMSRSQRSQ